jgi:hypothetical protein
MPTLWTDYVVATMVFNLQVLPESLMSGILLLAILLANQPLIAVAAGLAATQLATHSMGNLLVKYAPDGATLRTSMDSCSTGYVGKSWARLLGSEDSPERLWHPNAPSVFLATVGFFAGWGTSLQQLYKEEIDAGIMNKSLLITMGSLTAVVILLAFSFRIYSGCESYIGAAGGLVVGGLFGFLGCIALGYATDRRATNIWGIPLLRTKLVKNIEPKD